MKIKNEIDKKKLEEAVAKCQHDVWLESPFGDKFNLKSPLCALCGFYELWNKHREDLDLYCSRDDEPILFEFYQENKDLF